MWVVDLVVVIRHVKIGAIVTIIVGLIVVVLFLALHSFPSAPLAILFLVEGVLALLFSDFTLFSQLRVSLIGSTEHVL